LSDIAGPPYSRPRAGRICRAPGNSCPPARAATGAPLRRSDLASICFNIGFSIFVSFGRADARRVVPNRSASLGPIVEAGTFRPSERTEIAARRNPPQKQFFAKRCFY
jgi:hypothetical protein